MLPWKPQMWASMANNIHQPTSINMEQNLHVQLIAVYMVGSSFTKNTPTQHSRSHNHQTVL